MSNTGNDDRASPPIEVPEDIFERVAALCLALPEVTVRVRRGDPAPQSAAGRFAA
ncbi:MAG TPA: hypothetical protein VK817_22490 [Trebonia sp.]|nr:hypothetical protein [Trebonia sp.]